MITLFSGLRNSRSPAADGLVIKPVNYVLDLIAPVIAHIFNKAISCGVFPSSMRVARVTVIHKGGDKNSFSNYRPVSILPVFSKGLEKVINTRIESFSRRFNLLTTYQFGFRKNRSSEDALLLQKELILENIENKTLTVGLYLDFSKAFDRVNHAILLQKMECYGFRGVASQLLRSYLDERLQFTEIGTHRSRLRRISCGVPQGSILGEILFLFYINDIIKLNTTCHFIIYADDCTVFFKGQELCSIQAEASAFCSKLNDRCKALVLNEA